MAESPVNDEFAKTCHLIHRMLPRWSFGCGSVVKMVAGRSWNFPTTGANLWQQKLRVIKMLILPQTSHKVLDFQPQILYFC